MKKALSLNKLPSPTNLLRRVFSRSSSTETSMTEENNSDSSESKDEIKNLQDQVSVLQQTLRSLQEDIELKERTLATVTKEKDRILEELKRHKRTNLNLKQQLEDEREYYLKEKEHYCQEMTQTKKSKQKLNGDLIDSLDDDNDKLQEIASLKTELTEMKNTLNDTLEANYNLSVKFLRMKNTKYSLKARFKRAETEHAKVISDLTSKLDDTRDEIVYIIHDKFKSPLSPSNKKYLQNTQLMHENLYLQVQISKLHNEIERIKADKVKYETHMRLQYMRKPRLKAKCKADKMCQTNFIQEMEVNKIAEVAEQIVTKEKSSNILSEMSMFSLNGCQHYFSTIRTHSAPEMSRDDMFFGSELSLELNKEYLEN